jgi:phage shock protein A
MEERERGPMDPTRKLLKVFGVKVTDYEAKTDALLARWPAADASERTAIQAEALELSADLAHTLREITTHVLERQERVLAGLR